MHGSLTSNAAVAASSPVILLIEHAETVDLDGLPWPPIGDGWVLVCCAGGRTTWRRLLLQT